MITTANLKQKSISLEYKPFYNISSEVNEYGLCQITCALLKKSKDPINNIEGFFYTNIWISPRHWDNETKTIRVFDEISFEADSKLKNLNTSILEAKSDLKARNLAITPKAILKSISLNKEEKPTLLFVYRKFIQNKAADPSLTEKTKYRYYKRLALIKLYINTVLKKEDIEIAEVKIKFVEGYILWLKTVRKQAHDFSCKEIETLKAVIDYAILEEYYDKANVIRSYRIRRQNKPLIKYLTIEQVQRLYKTNFENEALNIVKDGFLLQCFTGLAYVDLANVYQENIYIAPNQTPWLSIERQKTGKRATLPLIREAVEIIEKYKEFKDYKKYRLAGKGLMPVFSNAMMNKLLKEIGLRLQIPLDVMCCHSGRKSFAMACLNNGTVSMETVSNMLGHSNTNITQRYYAKVMTTKIEREMTGFSFFKGN